MSIEFNFALRFAFILKPKAVCQIWEILDSGIGSVSATVQCADNSSREFTTASDLLKFDNARGKDILSLRLNAWSDDLGRSGSVAFRHMDFFDSSISASLRVKEEGNILQMRDKLQAALDGTRAWYSGISRINLFYVLMGGLSIFLLALIIAADGNTASTRDGVPSGRAIVLALQSVLFVCGFGVVCWPGLFTKLFF